MLKCRELAEIASDYIDGELNGRKALSVKVHLLMCRHCRSFVGNLRISNRLISAQSARGQDEESLRRIEQRVADALNARK